MCGVLLKDKVPTDEFWRRVGTIGVLEILMRKQTERIILCGTECLREH